MAWGSLVNDVPRAQGLDFTYPWMAAKFLLAGKDPYAGVAASRMPFRPLFLYPLPAAFVAIPFVWLSARVAAICFVALSCGWLAFALTRESWWRLGVFATSPAFMVAYAVQWSAFLMAAALTVPALGLLMMKPTMGLPLFAMQSTRRAFWSTVIGGALLTGIGLLLMPIWPLRWLETLRGSTAEYWTPILTPMGAVIAVSALRWRRPEARLLIAMALMPQNGFFYGQFPLLLVPQSRRELVIAGACSIAAFIPCMFFVHFDLDMAKRSVQYMPYIIAGLYWPALVMVLRRPNTAPA